MNVKVRVRVAQWSGSRPKVSTGGRHWRMEYTSLRGNPSLRSSERDCDEEEGGID